MKLLVGQSNRLVQVKVFVFSLVITFSINSEHTMRGAINIKEKLYFYVGKMRGNLKKKQVALSHIGFGLHPQFLLYFSLQLILYSSYPQSN